MTASSFLSSVFDSFRRRGCPSLAASLAFYSLLSLFPMVFLLLYGISFIVSQDVIGYQFLLGFLKGFLPSVGERLAKDIRRVAEQEEVRWAVFLAFGWFSALVFYELDYAMNTVFGTAAKRHPLISTLVAIALIWMLGFLTLISFVATQAIELLTTYAPRLWGLNLVAITAHDFLLTYSLPFLLAFVSVTCLYRFLPHQRPTWREATIGGALFSLLWIAAKALFVTYLEGAALYTQLYGSLLEVVLLLLWVYYSAALLLLGAVVTHEVQSLALSQNHLTT
ncbi:MAG: Ribonuclease BN [Nitrospira sp.]|jgi:membrane protein|nr:MAG: Ribonuclease BN [Nitrospira sp.]